MIESRTRNGNSDLHVSSIVHTPRENETLKNETRNVKKTIWATYPHDFSEKGSSIFHVSRIFQDQHNTSEAMIGTKLV